jgi:hypothetical protein
MAAHQEELLAYLSHALPPIPRGANVHAGPNTKNQSYSHEDITHVEQWEAFNYRNIVNSWRTVLHGPGCTLMNQAPIGGSPGPPIYTESQFKFKFHQHAENRIRRAMRRAFDSIDGNNHGLQQRQMSRLEFLQGDAAKTIDNFRPDYAMSKVTDGPSILELNRCPGDAKVSWKWQSAWRTDDNAVRREEFKAVLAQVNFYMKQHQTAYGFVVTDTELVPIRRLNNNGRLALGPRIPWSASNIYEPGEHGYDVNQARYKDTLTPQLALWYLGMLAANTHFQHMP